ncbi:MAG: aldehyde dehydrogenase family protein [Sphingomonadales bacterium]|nr:aldehyde dehydrogenase family protein [Sphingomonadales bacterium]
MEFEMLIDGRMVAGADRLEVINPATGAVFAQCARADAAQLDAAVAAASRAQRGWAALDPVQRGNCLRRLADALEQAGPGLARLLTCEQGKPLATATREVAGAVHALRFYAGLDLPLQTLHDTPERLVLEQRVPLGVVAAITPWNFPLLITVSKIAAALCVGNTVVAKPAPTTPLTVARFAALAAPILPAGVLNVIVDANDLGARLTGHPDVAKISFTGSTATGARVMGTAAEAIKRITLELGGNDAAVILDDMDVRLAARKVFDAAMVNAGQVCLAAKRIYAPAGMIDALCAELAALAEQTVVGNGLEQGVMMGPLQNAAQFERVLDLFEDSRRCGTVLSGGPVGGPGYFMRPAIVRDLPDDARLVREEQFGPIVPVLAYDDVAGLVERVNATPYGLGGSVWCADPARGIALARQIDSGTVWVNTHLGMPLDVPFGGAKQSGLGRENGIEGLKDLTQGKIIAVAR